MKKQSRSCRTSELEMQNAGLAEPQPIAGMKERRRIRLLDYRRSSEACIRVELGAMVDGTAGRLIGMEPDWPAAHRPATCAAKIREIARRLGLERGDPDINQLDRLSGQSEAVLPGMGFGEIRHQPVPDRGIQRTRRQWNLELVVLAGIAHVDRAADLRARNVDAAAEIGERAIPQSLQGLSQGGEIHARRIREEGLDAIDPGLRVRRCLAARKRVPDNLCGPASAHDKERVHPAVARPGTDPAKVRGAGPAWFGTGRLARDMQRLGSVVLTLAALASPLALVACGDSVSARSAILDADASASAVAPNPVAVSPLPGTADASPGTQISFLGAPGTRVRSVRVRGSRSGVHRGVLRAYSTGTGESFLPAHLFLPGERVTVEDVSPKEMQKRMAEFTAS